MRAWSAPDVPPLPVRAPEVRVHDSATGGLVELVPPSGVARMYVCGITPYDATHLGHAATYVAFDLLNRAWRGAGHDVRYVQNVTDVDDPLLERATATGEDWVELAERETELFRTDMEALRVLPPSAYVGAVEAIPLVVTMIEQLQKAGAVYPVGRDLYFSVTADDTFGSVSGWDRDQMLAIFAERGGDPDRPGKRDPLDCLLWQGEDLEARPDDPAWDSSLGRGRPGWHIECSAIARDHLGAGLDVQGGGSDLVFPHHEMSASEAQVAEPDVRFARAYVHAGMVALDGEKMSKSKGNLELVSRLRGQGVDPMAIRLALLGHHYRSDWEWTAADLAGAVDLLGRLREAVAAPTGAEAGPVIEAVHRALATDLDAPAALAVLRDWADSTLAGAGDEAGAGKVVADLADAALGLRL
ncbi:cysteine--1-D-myo-inosityl 2-amino-2-deoxy-alpha-D-glucopyranoside ligase [Nocardioides marmoriginsengisoli]|uniref:L-cysteine:1D-myo-inositol 2-amino-2-deoxy-alpha-D-glucopyranoside ligase n=1 Tax=Nocardioides marmoriginsengisoli TaxID=661483 RepID=A0A3N0CQN8_9ACTN|nr:cysteine--1-D-myo-inosityl 2-amino-2-deoxy-alpha-D-glucopyranoside ligase [Nocardioides marmoriginsengisoli]RNL65775.1 cysteine--1-D-myo-inosityl 2-amino-2-deoxy-alpha-D-glucopyranoside ligase [Nocardioides marmoriginsengisoli]